MSISEKVIKITNLEQFNAKVLDYQISDSPFSERYLQPENSIYPVMLKSRAGLRKISIVVDFFGTEKEQVENMIKFKSELMKGDTDLWFPDTFYYFVVYDKCSAPKKKAPWISQVKFNLFGLRHKEMVSFVVTGNNSIFCESNCETPAIIEVETNNNWVQFGGEAFQQLEIRNIKNKVTVDGIKKTIHERGNQNKFNDVEMTKFPSFYPGVNNFLILNEPSYVKVSFFPLFV